MVLGFPVSFWMAVLIVFIKNIYLLLIPSLMQKIAECNSKVCTNVKVSYTHQKNEGS
jgi:hypothetical protein